MLICQYPIAPSIFKCKITRLHSTNRLHRAQECLGVDRERLHGVLSGLGKPPAIEQCGLVMKRFPSCGYTHRVMDGALELRESEDFDNAQIRSITVSLPDFHAAILPFHQPTSRNEALFSAPFGVAAMLCDGDLSLRSLDTQRWQDRDIKDLISKTRTTTRAPINPRLNFDADDPDQIQIELDDGSVLTSTIDFPVGAPQRPLTAGQIVEKFKNNANGLEMSDCSAYGSIVDLLDSGRRSSPSNTQDEKLKRDL